MDHEMEGRLEAVAEQEERAGQAGQVVQVVLNDQEALAAAPEVLVVLALAVLLEAAVVVRSVLKELPTV